jgi:GNAT superfamily N-acetyltransferase
MYVLLAEEGAALRGFACVFLDTDPVWGAVLDNLHVEPGFKGRGLGRRLLLAAAAWCEARRPGTPLHLWVYERNLEARAFYERLGAVRVEETSKATADGGSAASLRYVFRSLRSSMNSASASSRI